MAETGQTHALDTEPRRTIRIGTGDLSVARHPIILVRWTLLSGQKGQQGSQRIDRKALIRRQVQHFASQFEIITAPGAAENLAAFRHDDFDAQIVKLEYVVGSLGLSRLAFLCALRRHVSNIVWSEIVDQYRTRAMRAGSARAATNSSEAALIEGIGLIREFGGLHAVDEMSIEVRRGEAVGLIGPNGAGKTTLFNLLAGSLRPTAGTIRIAGVDVSKAGPESRLRLGVGRTFQIPRPFASMTVLENALTGSQNQAGERIVMNFLRPGRVAAEERRAVEKARALLDFVDLSRLENEPARILSGGQRKLLELARILMADPQAILLDEPAAGVNPTLLELIIDRLLSLNTEGKTILLIEHNMGVVARVCGRVIAMAAGRSLAEGAPAAVAADPAVIAAYLGEAA